MKNYVNENLFRKVTELELDFALNIYKNKKAPRLDAISNETL
jgi:hypothetical protein